MICDEKPTRCDDAGQGHLVWGSTLGDGQGVVGARGKRSAEHRMHYRPHPQRWAAGAIASRVRCRCRCRCRGHPPQDDRSCGCDGVWASPQKKHLHDRACAMECHSLALGRSSLAGRPSTIRAPWWPCSWPCGCVVGKYHGATSMRWRIARRSRRSEVRSVATECSRRQTTPVVDWSNDTLSDEHGRAADFRVERRIRWISGREHQQSSKAKSRNSQEIKHTKTPNILYRISCRQSEAERDGRQLRECRFQKRSSRTVTVVRLPIGERREVDTGSAESAFERCSVDPKRKGRCQTKASGDVNGGWTPVEDRVLSRELTE